MGISRQIDKRKTGENGTKLSFRELFYDYLMKVKISLRRTCVAQSKMIEKFLFDRKSRGNSVLPHP